MNKRTLKEWITDAPVIVLAFVVMWIYRFIVWLYGDKDKDKKERGE